MNNFDKKVNELMSSTINENVKQECQKILEFSKISSYDLNSLNVRESFINSLGTIEKLDNVTETFIAKQTKRILLEKLNLAEIFSLLFESSDLNEIRPYVDYNVNNLYSVYNTKANSFYIAESLYSLLKPYDYIPTLSKELDNLKDIFENNKEEIVVLKSIYEINSLKHNDFYNEISEKLDDYFYDINNNSRNEVISYLNKYNYEPTVRRMIESLSMFMDKSNVFLNNKNPDYIVENVYSFLRINEGNSTFYCNGSFYEKNQNDIRVLSTAEVMMLPESYKIINQYIQSKNAVVEHGIISFDYGTTNIKFKMAHVNECYIDGVLIEGNPYQYIVQNGIFDYSIYEHVSILNMIWENLDALVNIDFAKHIKSKQYNDSVSTVLMKVNEKVYVNLINKYDNKNVMLSNLNMLQARNSIYEFMNYDISESLYEYMDEYTSKVGKLKETQKTINEQINILNRNLVKINEAILSDTIVVNDEVLALKENLGLEIRNLKRNYNKIQFEIDNISNVSESEDVNASGFVVNDKIKVKGSDLTGAIISIDDTTSEINVILDDGSTEQFNGSELEKIAESEDVNTSGFVVNDKIKVKGSDLTGSILSFSIQ